MINSFLIGVAGGSGSGKTYFSSAMQKALGNEVCEIVYQDNFYIDQSHRFDFDGGSVNFDHPNSIDFTLLADCLMDLNRGRSTQIPIYDFVTHRRLKDTIRINPKPVIIVDGILVLHHPQVRDLLHKKIFFDTSEEIRLKRRLERDIKERGRTQEGVLQQFFKQVKPMHDEFVEPSKSFADQVALETTDIDTTVKNLVNQIMKI